MGKFILLVDIIELNCSVLVQQKALIRDENSFHCFSLQVLLLPFKKMTIL